MGKPIRKIFFYGSYFQEFYESLDPIARKKVDWVLGLVCDLEVIPSRYFKHLTGSEGLYEIRIQVRRSIFRIFCFFDKGRLIVVLHGIQKKTQKTPKEEIIKAEKLKRAYYEQK